MRKLDALILSVGVVLGGLYLLSKAGSYAILPPRERRRRNEVNLNRPRVLMPGSPFSWN